ncbi:hypothetical protein M405DRAFT_559380 [Rhizopogon salebrosus TDB-379]|nr:hypothetical protein M405DRAFT_559380 [Rhizopogon salebrosus TDB-379]
MKMKTVENSTSITPLSRNDLTLRKSRSDLKLKPLASRGEVKFPTFRVGLKSRAARTNLKPKYSNADLKAQSPRGEAGTTHSPTSSGEDLDMQFRFIVQGRPVVVGLGLSAWRAQCPEMLESGQVVFQGHDFFLPQPALDLNSYPAVYIILVVLHEWPDARARDVLLDLRRASGQETGLIIAEHVLPLACVDDGSRATASELERSKCDLILNGYHERTLRERCALALSSGWRIVRVTFSKNSHFGHVNSVRSSVSVIMVIYSFNVRK